jgi:hypothetical protein
MQRTSGLADALHALKGRRGTPTDADRPRPKPFPGRKVRPIRGQLDFYGGEVGSGRAVRGDDDATA